MYRPPFSQKVNRLLALLNLIHMNRAIDPLLPAIITVATARTTISSVAKVWKYAGHRGLARPSITLATLKRAATSFAAW